jgi:hypothetical protein
MLYKNNNTDKPISIEVGIDDYITIEYSNIIIKNNIAKYLKNVYHELNFTKYSIIPSKDEHAFKVISKNTIDEWPIMPIPRPKHNVINIPYKDKIGNNIGMFQIIYLREEYNEKFTWHDTYVMVIYVSCKQNRNKLYTLENKSEYWHLTLNDKKYNIPCEFNSEKYNPVKYWEDFT